MPAKHTYALHYHNGHFYDPDTHRRVLLRDGAELQLTAPPEAFVPFEPAGDHYRHLRTEAYMVRELQQDPKVGAYYLLLPAGAKLHFVLHPPKPPVPDAKVAEYRFEVRLDEPLFAYRRPVAPPKLADSAQPKAKTTPDPGSLVDCHCQVYHATPTSHGYDENPNRLLYFEPVFAHSLNSLIKNTYVHYFQNAGAPGRSAFNVMLVDETGETLGELRERLLPELATAQ